MDKLIDIVELATKAPSGHNTQPWKFLINDDAIRLYPDKTRRLACVDADDHELYISIGCALENLLIAAQHYGFETEIEYHLENQEEYIEIKLKQDETLNDHPLFQLIMKRQSNRSLYNGKPIPNEHIEKLQVAAEQEGVGLELFTGEEDISPFLPWIEQATIRQYSNPKFIKELIQWMRFTPTENNKYRDGLSIKLLGLAYLPRWLGSFLLSYFSPPKKIAKTFLQAVRSSPTLLLFFSKQNTKLDWINVGRSFERVFLTAASLGIDLCLINMPCEVAEISEEMRIELLLGNARPMLLARIGYAQKAVGYSLRRSIEEVIVTN